MSLLAFGIASFPDLPPRPVARRGDRLALLSDMKGHLGVYFQTDALNDFMAAGPDVWEAVIARLEDGTAFTRGLDESTPHRPCRVGDYTDFYSSRHHAMRVGSLFRGPENALNPNWTQLPVGYHGRGSSIVVSGTPIRRPCGLRPEFGPTDKLDFELETGVYIGMPSRLGRPVPIGEAHRHVFGWTLVNDWSARDIQAFEYVPLGPFTSKNFATSVSPWIIPMSELKPYRRPLPAQDPTPALYLRHPSDWTYDIGLEVFVNGVLVSVGNQNSLYWSIQQQVAHQTVTGCPLNPGDLLASGTISGPDNGTEGCLLEKGGPYLADGDSVRMRAFVMDGVTRIDLCEVEGTIEPVIGPG
jgi:fumarylacetoacetase